MSQVPIQFLWCCKTILIQLINTKDFVFCRLGFTWNVCKLQITAWPVEVFSISQTSVQLWTVASLIKKKTKIALWVISVFDIYFLSHLIKSVMSFHVPFFFFLTNKSPIETELPETKWHSALLRVPCTQHYTPWSSCFPNLTLLTLAMLLVFDFVQTNGWSSACDREWRERACTGLEAGPVPTCKTSVCCSWKCRDSQQWKNFKFR